MKVDFGGVELEELLWLQLYDPVCRQIIDSDENDLLDIERH